jgi:glycosyltransferase involved in cell wall biosynthesis
MKAAIFVYVWPEPRSSAAGVRTVQLCQDLRSLGYEVSALSPCRPNEASAELEALGIRALPCPANDSSVDGMLKELGADLVIYDRFVMEEQFGWRARAAMPEALHIVDTQDIHSVRRARERLIRNGQDAMDLSGADFSPDLERELASLHRADACLVVSSWEKDWLAEQGYPSDRVFLLPFAAAKEGEAAVFSDRNGFAFLGNFRHAPNLDAVNHLAQSIWPKIRAALPEARLYLYGAYPPASISQLHGKNGIEVPGQVKFHRAALQKHKLLLAPLRFGAGIKGKILEAWATGTPVAGSRVAMEGLDHPAHEEGFVADAVRMYSDEKEWQRSQAAGYQALAPFEPNLLREKLREFLEAGFAQRLAWRAHLTGRMLRHHQHNSTKYFSQWIEAKARAVQGAGSAGP